MGVEPTLGYWDIRGLAQPIRMLLAQAGIEFNEKRYNYGPPPEFDRSEWLNEKFTLGLDFPNLPYYIDGDVKVTQSLAIIRYIARKCKLDGQSEDDKIRIDMAEQQLRDTHGNFTRLCYSPDFADQKDAYVKSIPAMLKGYSEYLGQRKWFAGENLSYVDFMIYESLDQHTLLVPDCLKEFPNLVDFHKRIQALPNIEKYMKSDKFMKYPLNGDMALFGSRLKPIK